MFDLTPLLTADLPIRIHAFAATGAIALLPLALLRRRRDRLHKIAGYGWVTSMFTAALSSFWISGFPVIGPFGPIHVLSVLVLFNLYWAIRKIRQRNVRAHQAIMKQTAFWGLGVAGLLTLVPGRIMNAVVFGSEPHTGSSFGDILSFAVLGVALLYVALRARAEQRRSVAR